MEMEEETSKKQHPFPKTEEELELFYAIRKNSTRLDGLFSVAECFPDFVLLVLKYIKCPMVLQEAHLFLLPTHKHHWETFLGNTIYPYMTKRLFIKMIEIDTPYVMEKFDTWCFYINPRDFFAEEDSDIIDRCINTIYEQVKNGKQKKSNFLLTLLQRTEDLRWITKIIASRDDDVLDVFQVTITEFGRIMESIDVDLDLYDCEDDIQMMMNFRKFLKVYFEKLTSSSRATPIIVLDSIVEALHFLAGERDYVSILNLLKLTNDCLVQLENSPSSSFLKQKRAARSSCDEIKRLFNVHSFFKNETVNFQFSKVEIFINRLLGPEYIIMPITLNPDPNV